MDRPPRRRPPRRPLAAGAAWTLALALALAAVPARLAALEPGAVATEPPGACLAGLPATPEPGYPGLNGPECKGSPYNCRVRPRGAGGNRVRGSPHVDSQGRRQPEVWLVAPGEDVLDGNGAPLRRQATRTHYRFNYGQVETFDGREHVFGMSTQNGSAGWYPLDALIDDPATPADKRVLFHLQAGRIARPAVTVPLEKMACYEIADSHDPLRAELKVVWDSRAEHEKAGDYLPLPRRNGRRSANLVYNTPGCAMGGTAINHFPAGTRFQRLRVPTDHGPPSLDVRLWDRDGEGRYRRFAGEMKFVYGYVTTAGGARRAGWMAHEALVPSDGCR